MTKIAIKTRITACLQAEYGYLRRYIEAIKTGKAFV